MPSYRSLTILVRMWKYTYGIDQISMAASIIFNLANGLYWEEKEAFADESGTALCSRQFFNKYISDISGTTLDFSSSLFWLMQI